MALIDLLGRGYFPKELPNPFGTNSYAIALTGNPAALPQRFRINLQRRSRCPQIGELLNYSHARVGFLRRQLSIPNPVSHFLLCREIDANWTALQPFIGGTALAATAPTQSAQGRAIVGVQPFAAKPSLAVQTRLNNRYILRTDISRFYHSIYTHTIPWALHTKPIAKGNRSMALLGNRLDCLIRSSQDGQTVGIPIGPDTSLVIAEILMQRCDVDLLSCYPGLRGHRYTDDYELGFRNRTDAEEAFHRLEHILGRYELALNPRKTRVLPLPDYLEAPWAAPLRAHSISVSQREQEYDLYSYFDRASELQRSYREDAVLSYAVARLRSITIHANNWLLFQRLLINTAATEPATLPLVLQNIIMRVNAGAAPATTEIEELLNALIHEHAPLGHSSEVAWSLWACLALRIMVSTQATAAIATMEDSAVALLALDCSAQGLTASPLNTSHWTANMSPQGLYGDQWLLSYEANVKGWLPSQGGGDHVAADPSFGHLKTAGVEFYDTSVTSPPATGLPIPVPEVPTPSPVSSGSL